MHGMLENKSNKNSAYNQHLLRIVGRSSTLKNMHSYQATTLGGSGSSFGTLRCTRRQSIPSRRAASCAGVSNTAPSLACVHVNFVRSSRLYRRHNPSGSRQIILTRSLRRPRKINSCPEKTSAESRVWTNALKPSKPARMSVTPATNQMRTPAGTLNMAAPDRE